jgi:hypothetical protein
MMFAMSMGTSTVAGPTLSTAVTRIAMSPPQNIGHSMMTSSSMVEYVLNESNRKGLRAARDTACEGVRGAGGHAWENE